MQTQVTITLIEFISITVSAVALIITIIGFFASLKFYRDGVKLQGHANDALTKIEEKTQFIQSQVGDIFGRTLDAAIGRKELLSESFARLDAGLEKMGDNIVTATLNQIGAGAGDQQRQLIAEVVGNEIEEFREKVATTQQSAESLAADSLQIGSSSTMASIFSLLRNEGGELTASEIAERLNTGYLPVVDSLRRLSEQGLVVTSGGQGRSRLYKISPEKPQTIAGSL